MKLFLYRRLLKSAAFFDMLARKADGAAHRLMPAQQVSLSYCEAQQWQNVRPCFVLSTGRAGTLLLTQLLQLSPRISVAHQPRPELIRSSKLAYEQIKKQPDIFRETFKSAREEMLLDALSQDQVFVETNNRITFFAPIIRDVFPNAVFIHLVRHPGSFVRSGIRRQWYSDKHEHDIGRIVPQSGAMKESWHGLSQIEKIGWLWNETNQFIEETKTVLGKNFLFVKAEDLFKDVSVTQKIYEFINVDSPSVSLLQKNLKPVNVQKKGEYPPYREWPENDKAALKRVAPLMKKYGYDD